MAKNISLLGADYPDVPAVVLPKTGGGTAMFVDPDEIIKFGSATKTTDNSGYASIGTDVFAEDVIILNVWSSKPDTLCFFFPSQNSTESGKRTWWFKFVNSDTLAAMASTTITFYYAYTVRQ